MRDNEPTVQIVIAVHTLDRPLKRAVASVLAEGKNFGVIVVAHTLSAEQLDLPEDQRITVIECPNGGGYPGVPFNMGIANATADLVGIMGSDDWFESGALIAMLERQQKDNADAVIAPLRHSTLKPGHNPLTLRKRNLQAVRDRLFYRTAPLGLFRREILQQPEYKFFENVFVGEDFPASVRLWTDNLSISHYGFDPAYVVGEDAKTRVTTTPRAIGDSMKPIKQLLQLNWVQELSPREKASLGTKLLRVHVLGTVKKAQYAHVDQSQWMDLADITRTIGYFSPAALSPLSETDRRVLDAVVAGNSKEAIRSLSSNTKTSLRQRIAPRKIADTIEHESNIRRTVTGAIVSQKQRYICQWLRFCPAAKDK